MFLPFQSHKELLISLFGDTRLRNFGDMLLTIWIRVQNICRIPTILCISMCCLGFCYFLLVYSLESDSLSHSKSFPLYLCQHCFFYYSIRFIQIVKSVLSFQYFHFLLLSELSDFNHCVRINFGIDFGSFHTDFFGS